MSWSLIVTQNTLQVSLALWFNFVMTPTVEYKYNVALCAICIVLEIDILVTTACNMCRILMLYIWVLSSIIPMRFAGMKWHESHHHWILLTNILWPMYHMWYMCTDYCFMIVYTWVCYNDFYLMGMVPCLCVPSIKKCYILQWRHTRVMASQITGNHLFISLFNLRQQTWKLLITGLLWEEYTGGQWITVNRI